MTSQPFPISVRGVLGGADRYVCAANDIIQAKLAAEADARLLGFLDRDEHITWEACPGRLYARLSDDQVHYMIILRKPEP